MGKGKQLLLIAAEIRKFYTNLYNSKVNLNLGCETSTLLRDLPKLPEAERRNSDLTLQKDTTALKNNKIPRTG